MAVLNIDIPDKDFESFQELLEENNDTLDKVSNYLLTVSRNDSFDKIESGIKEITEHYKIIFGLIYTFCRIDFSGNQFISELYEYFKFKTNKPIDFDFFNSKLSKIISNDLPVKFIIKSKILETTNPRNFNDSKILTDLRPIFRDKDGEELIGHVIVNQLKITYTENTKRKEFFITLDSNDLNQLKLTIERAERKVKVLESKKLTL